MLPVNHPPNFTLNLNGILLFQEGILKPQQKNASSCLMVSIFQRIVFPLSALLLAVREVASKLLFGTALLLAGLLSFSWSKIKLGSSHVLSGIIQLLALPLIGLGAFFCPSMVLKVTEWLEKYHQTADEQISWKSKREAWGACLMNVFCGTLAIPKGIVDGVTLSLIGLLNLNPVLMCYAGIHFMEGLKGPVNMLKAPFYIKNQRNLWNFYEGLRDFI